MASVVYTSLCTCMLFSRAASKLKLILPVYDINEINRLQLSYFGICIFMFIWHVSKWRQFIWLHRLWTCFGDSIKVDLHFGVENPTKIDMMCLQGFNSYAGISERGT